MAEVLSIISIISFVIAGICLTLAVFFWFKFDIPAVIGDLSGRTARKSIAKMREENEKSGNKSYRSSIVNRERVVITNPISGSKVASGNEVETGILLENRAENYDSEQTALLIENEETALLVDDNKTAPLEAVAEQSVVRSGGKHLKLLEEVMLVHTNEVIQ